MSEIRSPSNDMVNSLLVGYSMDCLTPEEEQDLLNMATSDQTIFDALVQADITRKRVQLASVRHVLMDVANAPADGRPLKTLWADGWGVARSCSDWL